MEERPKQWDSEETGRLGTASDTAVLPRRRASREMLERPVFRMDAPGFKNEFFPLKPPKTSEDPVFSKTRKESFEKEDVRTNCKVPGKRFQWIVCFASLQSVSKLLPKVCSLAVCSYPSVPSNYN